MTLTFKHVLVEYKHIQVNVRENMMLYSFDIDLDPMTLILKLDLDMLKVYLHTKNEVPCYSSSKLAGTGNGYRKRDPEQRWTIGLGSCVM